MPKTAKSTNELRLNDEYGEFKINSKNPEEPEIWIRFDLEDLELVQGHSWYINTNGFACATIKRKQTPLHRLLMGTVGTNVYLEFANEDKQDYRRANIVSRTKRMDIVRAEKKKEDLAKELAILSTEKMTVEVRKSVNTVALSQAASMLAVLVEIAQDAENPPAARIQAANAILDRAIGKAGIDETFTPAQLPSINISFTEAPKRADLVEMVSEDVIDITPVFK